MAYTATFDLTDGVGYIHFTPEDDNEPLVARSETRGATVVYDYDSTDKLIGIEIIVNGSSGVSIETPPQYGHGE
jgi:YD repeat-containing protein